MTLHKDLPFDFSEEKRPLKDSRKSNPLINEASSYLRSHAYNPVYWYPWGPEALGRAKKEDKPIFLSVGYSSCHWCHIMRKEVFDIEVVGDFLNQHFISIKVDREERPDLDAIYMEYLRQVSGGGGWPMSLFLTPLGKPFWGGTYVPHDSFLKISAQVVNLWLDPEKQREIQTLSHQFIMNERLKVKDSIKVKEKYLSPKEIRKYLKTLFDPTWGGFGGAPKFPPTMILNYLMELSRDSKESDIRRIVQLTLTRMFQGGIYDHLGGGFHRYSVDEKWRIPHFEKMLYDQALIIETYLESLKRWDIPLFNKVVRQTLAFVMEEMCSSEGGFYSSFDADSEEQEGIYYLWEFREIEEILGKSKTFNSYYNISSKGNFSTHEPYHDKKNILYISPDEEESSFLSDSKEQSLKPLREILKRTRKQRVSPSLDDKIILSWNALMVSTLAKAFDVLKEPEYLFQATKAYYFLKKEMQVDGVLYRVYHQKGAKILALLEDYAYLSKCTMDLFWATNDILWISETKHWFEEGKRLFHDSEQGGFFQTRKDEAHLILRIKNGSDSSLPSANAILSEVSLFLYQFTLEEKDREFAMNTLRIFSEEAKQSPYSAASLYRVMYILNRDEKSLVVLNPREEAIDLIHQRKQLKKKFNKASFIITIIKDPSHEALPLFEGKELLNNKTTYYYCEGKTCYPPSNSLEEVCTIKAH